MTPRPILSAAEMRAADAAMVARGIPVEMLMARAGAAVAEAAWRFGGGRPTLILCGPGNNGGDGYVAARLLAARGAEVRVAAAAEPASDACRAARAAWAGPVEALAEAAPAQVLVDALFGTGLTRAIDSGIAAALAALAGAAHLSIAVDLPSGVGSDDGALLNDVPGFDMTIALAALKPAHLLQPAAASCGTVRVVDIGIGLDDGHEMHEIAQPYLPAPGPADHKYTRGFVAVIGGAMRGAAMLAASAAQKAGAGYVMLAGQGEGGALALVRRAPANGRELAGLLDDARIGAVVIGPGLGRDGEARSKLDAAIKSGRPLVIDADALLLLAGKDSLAVLAKSGAPAILTPHEGEFAKLFGDLPGSKPDRVRAAAESANAVVLLKGADTVVARPDGRVAIAPSASSWLASAGTGDVLAGTIAAMLARGLDPFAAAQAGCWLHGEAARRAGPGMIADDLLAHLPTALDACA